MTILRKLWTEDSEEVTSAKRSESQYVLELRNRVEETCKIAQEHLAQAKKRYAKAFNRRAKERWFDPGDKVLLLRPVKHNKLQLTWQGPFAVLERIGDWDYRVRTRVGDKVYHANLLK